MVTSIVTIEQNFLRPLLCENVTNLTALPPGGIPPIVNAVLHHLCSALLADYGAAMVFKSPVVVACLESDPGRMHLQFFFLSLNFTR